MAPKTRKVGRDSRTGEFVPLKETERRPNTTEVETVPVKPAKKKK